MDDFNVSSLHESRNEWCAKLITILTPLVIDGYKSILDEAVKLCKQNNEMDKYLMTFQNFVSRIPKWNSTIIETERKRICDKSGCVYLEDLVTCVHVIQLKVLTAMRVGQKQKKIDLDIPKLDDFIHKLYISVARKVYKNVYLFELNIPPLQTQKHNRELEIIVQECILTTVRDSIPVEAILKAYLEETVEENVTEEIKEEVIEEPKEHVKESAKEEPSVVTESERDTKERDAKERDAKSSIRFNDVDYVKGPDNTIVPVEAPKTDERLKQISDMREEQRKFEEAADDDNDYENVKLSISDQPVVLDNLDVHDLVEPSLDLLPDLLIDEIEVLE
jgi:hypothetical protein